MLNQKAILFDANRCIGCGTCHEARIEKNSSPETNRDFLKDHLWANTSTVVEEYSDVFTHKMYTHCLDPACISVCLVGTGLILNRINVGVTSASVEAGQNYFPGANETGITLMLLFPGMWAFRLITNYFLVFQPIPVKDS
jgi:ferredoxin